MKADLGISIKDYHKLVDSVESRWLIVPKGRLERASGEPVSLTRLLTALRKSLVEAAGNC